MTTSSFRPHNSNNVSSPITGLTVILFFFPIWFLIAIQLLRVQEIWFDPWDVLPSPAEGTTAAGLNQVIKGPLFVVFSTFVLGGNLALVGWKMWRSAEKSIMVRKILKAQSVGLIVFTGLIFVSRLQVANLWSDRTDLLTMNEYISYNHYIRTAPFIVLGFLLFAVLFWTIWRTE